MIAGMTMAAAGVRAASPQQQEGESSSKQPAATSIDAPIPNAEWRPSVQHPNWITTPASDLLTTTGRLAEDQKQIWTSPLRLRLSDAEWLVPVAGVTTGFLLTDPNFSKALPSSPQTLHRFQDVRNAGLATLGAASGGLYLWSLHTRDPHQRETGLLAGEAVIDSLLVSEGLQLIASRERPLQADGGGKFFQGGSSFPSNHSAAAWAAAGILAHEYHGTLTKLLAYGLASTISVASVGSKQHFPSDVLIGSGLGWLVSEYVYREHHNPELGGAAWNPLKEMFHDNESGPAKNPGSPYVPVDSWVYAAFDRLAALGYVSAGYQGKRPWSRQQCALLLVDADASLTTSRHPDSPLAAEARSVIAALHREFAREEATFTGPNESAEIDSLYTRILSANGTVLNDGYHFGQTFAYDYGRPFRQGTNLIDGGSASATYGSLFLYIDAEYQHSPAQPALSAPVREFIAISDKGPLPSDQPFAPINQFALLDAYAGINLQGWQISFGNQSLAWGPGPGGSLLLSNNAAPFPMLRVVPVKPFEIPGISKILGPFSVEQFVGRLEGHAGPSQPWIYGQKASLKPFPSLEFAYSRTTLIGGTGGDPITTANVLESAFGRVNSVTGSVPGDSRTAIDWTWRLPKMNDWITFYGEMEDDDDLIPLQNVSKSVLRPGIYFSRLPWLPKWDVHFEWTSSTSPGRAYFQSHGYLNYWNLDYPDGYTNDGNLMANVVGREGVTLQGWIRYWASPRHTLDLSWKQSRVFSDFVPGGGKWQDYQASYSITRASGVYFKGFLQLEHIFSYPLLFPGSRNNLVAAVELGFLPQWGRHTAVPVSPASSSGNSSVGGPLP
jgi:capsule assembly protein Wzi/PAP2 superfamily protein